MGASEALEASLFKLMQKNIHNAVIWLEDQPVDMEAIRRLRGLGMNMVFFDVVTRSPYADGALLDNQMQSPRCMARCMLKGARAGSLTLDGTMPPSLVRTSVKRPRVRRRQRRLLSEGSTGATRANSYASLRRLPMKSSPPPPRPTGSSAATARLASPSVKP